ncbi:MAG: M28 family metallopeptidase [Verrucomicrobiota bacterium]|jgi:carboxypeptidase Q
MKSKLPLRELLAGGAVLAAAAMAAMAQKELPAGGSPADRLIAAATNTDFAYRRLARLCDTFGPRQAGSTNLEAALDWILQEMKKDGLDNVHGEEVMVPHWVRGAESAEMLQPRRVALPMLGLGNSIGTPPAGLTAEVLVVTNFAELQRRAKDAAGKIVLINQPFETYGRTVRIRRDGAVEAAKAGAVASLIRSVTPVSLKTPHTGAMLYSDTVPKIPHAAITVEDADMMQRMQERGEKIVVHLQMSAATLPDVPSRNIIGEITGRDLPDEVVIVSGHIDSWDVGQGAEDDGGGAISAWEAVRLMKQLGLRPRRTVRAVLWTDEENGGSGAKGYEKRHKAELAKHILAIESDSGAFQPRSFSFAGSDKALANLKEWTGALAQLGMRTVTKGGGDADVNELVQDGVPVMSLHCDSTNYFWYHHSAADTMDKLNPQQLGMCAAAFAVMAWQVADAPADLPR